MRSIEWAAGLIEGEGSFMHRKIGTYSYPTVQVGSTDLDVVEELQRIFGAGLVRADGPRPRAVKQLYRWRVHKLADAVRVTQQVLPFMCERRRGQAEAMLQAVSR